MGKREKRDFEKAVNIIRDAGGKVVGRTRLQKIAFFLEIAGLGEGFRFEYRHYGPYSEQLTNAISTAAMGHLISEEERSTTWGGTYSIFTAISRSAIDTNTPATRVELIRRALNANPVDLELAATAAFLAREGEPDPWVETARRKPEKASRLDEAKSLYIILQEVPTPLSLPAISAASNMCV